MKEKENGSVLNLMICPRGAWSHSGTSKYPRQNRQPQSLPFKPPLPKYATALEASQQ